MKYLLDTCVLSEFVKPKPNRGLINFINNRVETDLFISAMTLGEIYRGIQNLANGKKKSALITWLGDIETRFSDKILPFDRDCAIEWARISSVTEKNGKKLSAFDSIIAAIASRNSMVIVTRNVKDFIETGIELINPWEVIDK